MRPSTANSVVSMDLDLSIRATTPSAWHTRQPLHRHHSATPTTNIRFDSPSSRVSTPRTIVSRSSIRSETPRSSVKPDVPKKDANNDSVKDKHPPWRGASPRRIVQVTTSCPPKPTPKRSKLHKHQDFVDESLFGNKTSHKSVEEEHKELHQMLKTKPFMTKSEEEKPKVSKARNFSRVDFNKPIDLPGGPKPDVRRFARTKTLEGGYEPPRPAKPGTPAHQSQGQRLLEHQRFKPSSTAPPKLNTPFVHETVPPPERRRKPPNNLWGYCPDV